MNVNKAYALFELFTETIKHLPEEDQKNVVNLIVEMIQADQESVAYALGRVVGTTLLKREIREEIEKELNGGI